MKVLFFIPTLLGGGAEKVLSNLVKMLYSDKYEITVKTLFNEGVYFKSMEPYCKIESCFNTENRFNYWFYHSLINHSHLLPRKLLWKWFINKHYEVEIAFMEGVCTRIVSGSCNSNSKKIAWIHTDLVANPESLKQFYSFHEAKRVYNYFNNIITVSDQARLSYKQLFGLDAIVIPNPIDKIDLYEKSNKNNQIDVNNRRLRMISIGRLEKIKGFERLLSVHQRLILEGYELDLSILGDGSLRAEIESYIETNHLHESVHLLGFQTNPYVYISKSDLLVSTSFVEGYSLVIAEALVLGIPVLATETAGANEILGANNEMIIANDEDAIYENLKLILNDTNRLKSMKQKAEIYAKYYNPNQIIQKIEQLLD